MDRNPSKSKGHWLLWRKWKKLNDPAEPTKNIKIENVSKFNDMFNQDTFLSDDQQGIEISQLMSDFGIFL